MIANLPNSNGRYCRLLRNGNILLKKYSKSLMNDFEEYQYLGDTASLRLLDDLPNGGLKMLRKNGIFSLDAPSPRKAVPNT